jgi:hypothetical protein
MVNLRYRLQNGKEAVRATESVEPTTLTPTTIAANDKFADSVDDRR